MRLAVAIPTFNGRHLLQATLPSYAAQVESPDQLIVVDDGSTDGTVEWLREEWPRVHIVLHSENRGITAALNTCLEAAQEADYVGLFNNDVELAPGALAALCAALDDAPEAAAVGPKMVNYFDRDVLDGTGDLYSWAGTAARRGQWERDNGQYDQPGRVFGVCAGAAVYRSAALRVIGLFDEALFAYLEDVEWSLRANLSGHPCIYEPTAVVFHMNSATTGSRPNAFSSYHVWRNQIWIVARHWSGFQIMRHAHLLALGQALNASIALRRGLLPTLVRAWRDGLAGVPERRRLRRRQTRSSAGLALPRIVGFHPPWRRRTQLNGRPAQRERTPQRD
ncbi:MAG: glycosyltransferase family 2 protein [Actinomycetota bacterium]|nr:glycosyltransferase family 2 protein [Actinomycetota bacterium]